MGGGWERSQLECYVSVPASQSPAEQHFTSAWHKAQPDKGMVHSLKSIKQEDCLVSSVLSVTDLAVGDVQKRLTFFRYHVLCVELYKSKMIIKIIVNIGKHTAY